MTDLSLSGRAEFLAAALRLISETHDQLSLLTQALDPRVFGEVSFADAIKQFLLSRRSARLRVLVAQPQLAVRGPHALVDLGRLLVSRVEFREFAPDNPAPAEEMLLADGRLLLERNGADSLAARLLLNQPQTARAQQRRFDTFWDYAVPSMELRRLRL